MIIATSLAAGIMFAGQSPATALPDCPGNVANLSNVNYATATNIGYKCHNIQARLQKYQYGNIVYYYGPEAVWESYAYSTNGADMGKHYRYKKTSSSSWTGYIPLPPK